ncbi:MAG: hypothetical protein JSV74_01510 [Dehalococcoidia bacterium]|nr:MAG: hypothetical protein JSV74_01510 [Dehalococcoidia bacterium]
MKKFAVIGLAVLLVLVIGVSPIMAAKPGTDFNGPHYNLNLIGKEKVMPGDKDNPDRHTMFVPLDTTGMTFDINTPNNLGEDAMDGIKIEMTQGSEFAMIDGNATDGYGAFQLGPGKYHVYIAVKAKSPKYPNAYTDITGWVEAYDNLGNLWYYIDVGYVQVKKGKNSWTDATDLFFVNLNEDDFGFLTGDEPGWVDGLGMWVFDYMTGLDTWYEDTLGEAPYDLSDLAYFWQFDNHGNKLIQVRFYPM